MMYYKVFLYNGCGGHHLGCDPIVMYVDEEVLLNTDKTIEMVEYVNKTFNTPNAAPYYMTNQPIERVDLSQTDIDKCKKLNRLYPVE